MRVALCAAAAALAVALVTGCGGDARDDVESYIRDVNTLQQELLVSLTQASAAYRSFATDERELAKQRPKLVAAERSVRRLDRRLAGLDPPPEARRLHRLLRDLTRAEVKLADELERASAYLPQYTSALRPLEGAQTRLRNELGSAKRSAAQATAMRRFERAVAAALERLQELDAPAFLSGTHETQSAALKQLRDSAADLAAALEEPDRAEEIPRLVQRLLNAPLSARSVAAQRRRIDAVKAYNARVDRVEELARRVERERLRLQASLR